MEISRKNQPALVVHALFYLLLLTAPPFLQNSTASNKEYRDLQTDCVYLIIINCISISIET